MKRTSIVALAVTTALLIGYVSFGVNHLVSRDVQMKHNDVQLEVKSAELKKLELDYKTLNSKLNTELQKNQTNDATLKQLQQEKEELDRRNKELEQARATREAEKQRIAQAAAKAVNTVTGTATASAAPSGAKAFIYAKESGNRTDAINPSSGACGLGQALPCSKLPCTLSDYACQDAWFTNYAMQRYGSWEAAQAFWVANHWW